MSNRDIIEILTEMIEEKDHIIDLDNRNISELIGLLHQHMATKDINDLPVMEDISEAARLRREMRTL